MPADSGSNAKFIRQQNRCLAVKTIATHPPLSRGEIAAATGLTRMTMSNIITELIQMGVVRETESERADTGAVGRRPTFLDLAPDSPCVCGIDIGRRRLTVALGDLRANIFARENVDYPDDLNADKLARLILIAFHRVKRNLQRRMLGVGISVMGPVSVERGMFLSPSNFFGIENVPIVRLIAEATRLPVFLMPDNCAGALAEKLYGRGRDHADFLFLLLKEGIGCGIIVDHRPYGGASGLCGELGHTSINFDGPPCACGNRGCLEQYANTRQMARFVREAAKRGCPTVLPENAGWADILSAADRGDAAARGALNEYCDYLACALVNYINVFDPETVFLCDEGFSRGGALRDILEGKVRPRVLARPYRCFTVENATFGADAIPKGALSIVAARVFDGTLPLA